MMNMSFKEEVCKMFAEYVKIDRNNALKEYLK